ncbi:MAG TPA: phosphoribosylformylglycinamidine synthase subunit PurS [Longimicrobium sp.]|uniref:phosphoribosylformylglycinamidine synthase subunit PurS n=1 Tax=Longimicrobium sp. TaxID=2029185 RepID=UPI002EDAB779
MTDYRIEVRVTPRRGILDPQGKAVGGALASLGFDGVDEVHVGRLIVFGLRAGDEGEARERVDAMCRQLLANPVTEDFAVTVAAGSAS